MYTIDVSLQKFIFKEVLEMTGTNTFTVISMEDLEQASGGVMVWLAGDRDWSWPYAYSIATDQKTILADISRRAYGIGF